MSKKKTPPPEDTAPVRWHGACDADLAHEVNKYVAEELRRIASEIDAEWIVIDGDYLRREAYNIERR